MKSGTSDKSLRQDNIAYLVMFFCIFIIQFQAKGQPGWQDYTLRYFYSITDNNGNEIEFDGNEAFEISVDGKCYSKDAIPNDILPAALPNKGGHDVYIRINDFSLQLPPKHYNDSGIEIIIIHSKDSMFLHQKTGVGSTKISPKSRETNRTQSDRTLKFIPGCYYFPHWTAAAYDKLPLTKGNVKIVNAQQHHFIIPKKIYESLKNEHSTYKSNQEIAAEYVLHNFMSAYYEIEKKIQASQIDKTFKPFRLTYGFEKLYPTPDSNIYVGLIRYNLDSLNWHISKHVFATFNKNENSIQHWSPRDNLMEFYCESIYKDDYNQMLYLSVGVRNLIAPCTFNRANNCPYETFVYTSPDFGVNWKLNGKLSAIFDLYKIRDYHFLDKNYRIAYSRREKSVDKFRYHEGVYYLLKDDQVIDSFITPKETHYNDNYNGHNFKQESSSSVNLGRWGITPRKPYGSYAYSKLYILKEAGEWKFKVFNNTFDNPYDTETKNQIALNYKNFVITGDNMLYFKNGAGALQLNDKIVSSPHLQGIYIIEKDAQIFLINNSNGSIMFSFDAGRNWFIHPKTLFKNGFGPQSFFNLSAPGTLSYFNLNRVKNGIPEKVTHEFKMVIK
jgi:hypothetical protein